MAGAVKAHYEGIKAFSETDLTEDLKSIKVPVLVLHGEDDQIVPFHQAPKTVALLQNGKLIAYPGFPHGMPTTEAETINKDILDFIKS
ncbi:Non-heme chloroperoxidase [compost metagenome]